ncbi:MAG: hypothetical protein HYT30_01770 [Parcubacteria group bacterium]|nr:hypothetical protein [Parcubacteria group bacterium]
MQSHRYHDIKVHKGQAKKRKSADGIWRARTYGFSSRGGEERLRTRLRRVRVISLSAGALLALVAFGSVAFASYQPRLQIAHMDVRGEQALSEQALLASAHSAIESSKGVLFSEKSMLFFPRAAMEERINNDFPRVASAVVSVDSYDGQSVAIDIQERNPFARWCDTHDECYLLDTDGYVFAPYAGETLVRDEIFSGGMPSGDPVGRRYLDAYFKRVMRTVEGIELAHRSVTAVRVINDQEYHLTLAEGTVLYVRFSDDPESIFENLNAILTSEVLAERLSEVAYIDLRFDGRAYYKFKAIDN